MSAPYWAQADIVFWPEAAIPAFYDVVQPFFDAVAANAAHSQHTLIAGVPFRIPPSRELPEGGIYNSAVALGVGEGVYHKQHLVPFGEYVPLEKYLRGLIQFFDLPMSDFYAGPSDQPPLRAGNLTFAPYICYEVVYGDLVRHARADVLLTLSNDAWFGHSIGPLQHLQMAQMRALELGRYMVRSTGNGVTAIIDEKGRIAARAPQFERTVLTGSIEGFSGLTPYARFGSWPILSLCGIIVALCCLRRARNP
jgi:apolipoprotein N-acyltransferase